MIVTSPMARWQRPSRFSWLMGMYAENYWTLTRLLGPQQLRIGR